MLQYGPVGQRRGEGMSLFVNVFQPPPRLLVLGAIDFAASMVLLGAFLGYRVTACDALGVFTTAARIPAAN
jgi:xanthine dehydrogenase accessory factor